MTHGCCVCVSEYDYWMCDILEQTSQCREARSHSLQWCRVNDCFMVYGVWMWYFRFNLDGIKAHSLLLAAWVFIDYLSLFFPSLLVFLTPLLLICMTVENNIAKAARQRLSGSLILLSFLSFRDSGVIKRFVSVSDSVSSQLCPERKQKSWSTVENNTPQWNFRIS